MRLTGKAKGQIKAHNRLNGGYLAVHFYDGHQGRKLFLLHRLVAAAFLEPPPPKRPHVNHRDTDKTNCAVDNLEYTSAKENQQHAAAHGLTCKGIRNGSAKLTDNDVRTIRLENATRHIQQRALAKRCNISQATVNRIVLRKTWRHVDA